LAGGGDGTVNEVAMAIQNKKVSFGILPLGTTNALSHVLYGNRVKSSPIQTACDAILANKTMQIDAATCNEHLLLLAAGIGFEQKMIAGADRTKKNELGQLAYI
jgi:diacylglycerol kinase family enzyme